MSERKTAEIKFRIEPSVKAHWQADADAKDISLSALIVETMNSRAAREQLEHVLWEEQNRSLCEHSLKLIPAPAELEDRLEVYGASPQADVGTSDEVGAKEVVLTDTALAMRPYEPKSWMFEGRDA